jgi:hypothetical protein
MAEKDPALARIERGALVWCGFATLGALAWRRGIPDVALGVLGGGALVGTSYWAIKTSATRLTEALARRAVMSEPSRASGLASPSPCSCSDAFTGSSGAL